MWSGLSPIVCTQALAKVILYHKGGHYFYTKIKTQKTIYIIIQKRSCAILSKQWYIIQRSRGRFRYIIEEYPLVLIHLCVRGTKN